MKSQEPTAGLLLFSTSFFPPFFSEKKTCWEREKRRIIIKEGVHKVFYALRQHTGKKSSFPLVYIPIF